MFFAHPDCDHMIRESARDLELIRSMKQRVRVVLLSLLASGASSFSPGVTPRKAPPCVATLQSPPRLTSPRSAAGAAATARPASAQLATLVTAFASRRVQTAAATLAVGAVGIIGAQYWYEKRCAELEEGCPADQPWWEPLGEFVGAAAGASAAGAAVMVSGVADVIVGSPPPADLAAKDRSLRQRVRSRLNAPLSFLSDEQKQKIKAPAIVVGVLLSPTIAACVIKAAALLKLWSARIILFLLKPQSAA